MSNTGRKVVDTSFTGLSIFGVVLMGAALLVILVPIFTRGMAAFVFRGTIEHRLLQLEQFAVGDRQEVLARAAAAEAARQPVYNMLAAYEERLAEDFMLKLKKGKEFDKVRKLVHKLLGPPADAPRPPMVRNQYGQTRWDRAQVILHELLYVESYDYGDGTQMGKQMFSPRVEEWRETELEPLFAYTEENLRQMLLPRWTLYWRFLTQKSIDAHIFGGIWPEVLGTLYLTVGAMLFAVPMGVIAAIYLVEYAGEGRLIGLLRSCISTLAGVPSIVFGLFGLAFFINAIHVSPSKSVLAGSLTLGLLVLPTVIRASEEAIRAVPSAYKEAALSLGASKWRTVVTVLLPAALPGILTGIVISMGRAAGETAPIIFTAAVSIGRPLGILDTLNQPTPALPWNIYNLATEHEAVDEIRHVQYGMVMTLVMMVLLLNAAALILRARIARKLRG